MKRSRAPSKHEHGGVLALFSLLLVTALAVASTAGATVWTDKDDYTPGSVVTISGDNGNGAGYLPGETVRVDVTGPNSWTATCDAVADAAGAWSCEVRLADGPEAVGEYSYTAMGLVSGVTENGRFTDASFWLRAAVGSSFIAVTFPGTTSEGSIQRFTNSTCSGTPAGFRTTDITTPATGAFANVTGGIVTTAGGSIKVTAPATSGQYIFSSWQVAGSPVNGTVTTTGTAGCFSGWDASNPTFVQANYVLPDPEIKVEKSAAAEYFVAGGPVGFEYTVTNEGNVPLSNVGVTDTEFVGPTYQSGDTNTNNLLDLTETWLFTGSYTPAFTGPSSILDNVATASGTYAATTVQDRDGLQLMGAVIRKAVHLYWQAGGPDKIVPYDASGVYFDVDLYERGEGKVGTEQVAEDDPLQLWLTLKPTNASGPGWQFVEQPKAGYPVADARGTINFSVGPGGDYLDSTLINTIEFDLSVKKTAPLFVGENGLVTFNYEVKNIGPAAVTPVVTDDKCSDVKYLRGDANNDGLIQPTETWTFRCNDTLSWNLGWNFDTGKQLCDTNTASVVDDELPNWTGEFYGGELTTPSRSTVTLCPQIIRKDVIEFGTGNQLSDTTTFTVTIKQGAKTITTVTIKEGDPAQIWLQPGTYQFCETVLPFYSPNFECWEQDVGIDYPDWTVVNSKWYGFSHGYYKNQGHRIGWQALAPPVSSLYMESTALGDVFSVPAELEIGTKSIGAFTLYEALSFKGGPDLAGKAQILLRQAVAAVLNESRFGASFGDFTLAELIEDVNDALASGSGSDMTELAGELAMWNNGYVVAP